MFQIPEVFQVIETYNKGFSNPTEMGREILTSLTGMLYDSPLCHKFVKGRYRGKGILDDIQFAIQEDGFEFYLQSVEQRIRDMNFKNSKFDLSLTLEALFEQIKNSDNLPESVYLGLCHSYQVHASNRPYLFLAECLYYALSCRHDKTVSYKTLNIFEVNSPTTLPAWRGHLDEAILNENLPPKFWSIVEQMTANEVAIFKNLASLAIIDEDEKYYLYAPVTDDEIQLYKDFGIGNTEFLLMEEFGLINLGAKVDNSVEVMTEPAGFQNDNLVFMFTTNTEPLDISYKSYSFTTVGLKLLELLAIATNDRFFEKLLKLFVQQHSHLPIHFYLAPVEVIAEAENIEELEGYRLT